MQALQAERRIQHPQQIKEQIRQLAQAGSESYDQCIELVCRNVPEALRVEALLEAGISDASLQLLAWAEWQQLKKGDPLLSLTNSQRLALFSQDPTRVHFLMSEARDHIARSLPISRITVAWAKSKVAHQNAKISELASENRKKLGYKTSRELLAENQERIKDLESQVARLERVLVSQEKELAMYRPGA
tara:strand:+ start:8222 stop:8788 length:567 start_codon:yes stop_codon:yes gene_type:complete